MQSLVDLLPAEIISLIIDILALQDRRGGFRVLGYRSVKAAHSLAKPFFRTARSIFSTLRDTCSRWSGIRKIFSPSQEITMDWLLRSHFYHYLKSFLQSSDIASCTHLHRLKLTQASFKEDCEHSETIGCSALVLDGDSSIQNMVDIVQRGKMGGKSIFDFHGLRKLSLHIDRPESRSQYSQLMREAHGLEVLKLRVRGPYLCRSNHWSDRLYAVQFYC